MTNPQIITLLIFLFPLAYSPGPGNMFFAAIGARSGLYASLPANFGYHLATLLVSFLIGLGFFVMLVPGSYTMVVLRFGGALYIFWLAYGFWGSKAGPQLSKQYQAGIWRGALLLVLNPKGYLIMALMFSQFPSETWLQTGVIAAVFTLNNLVAFLVWTVAGQFLARIFHNPKAARRLNSGFAMCLAATALWLLFS